MPWRHSISLFGTNRTTGLSFRSDVVASPGGRQILIADSAGNLIELFQPAHQPAAPSQTNSSSS